MAQFPFPISLATPFVLVLASFTVFADTNLDSSDIKTISVSSRMQTQWVVLDANIEAVKAATVSAQTSGRIVKLNYDVNDEVPSGAALLEITSKEQGAELAGAEADYAKAKAQDVEAQAQLRRYAELFPQGAISKGSMDEATANARSTEQAVSAAQARIVKATESLKYTVVSAPFSGIITQKHVEQGETVSPGQALLSGFATDEMRAVTHVPERYINILNQQPQMIVTLSDGQEFQSQDLSIFSFANPSSHSYQVRIKLANPDQKIKPGTWAKVRFAANERPQMTIPASALITVNELYAVYRKQADKFVLNQVRIGKQQAGEVDILSGLQDNDEIALDATRVFTQLADASR